MLWAITAYFNPPQYKSRLINYRTFRKYLRGPLVAVELSFTGRLCVAKRRRYSRLSSPPLCLRKTPSRVTAPENPTFADSQARLGQSLFGK